jgi:hypothetical protein
MPMILTLYFLFEGILHQGYILMIMTKLLRVAFFQFTVLRVKLFFQEPDLFFQFKIDPDPTVLIS